MNWGAWLKAEAEYLLWKVGFYHYCWRCDVITTGWNRAHRRHGCWRYEHARGDA